MTEPRYRATPPRWFKAGSMFDEPAVLGVPLPAPPRLVTRVLPVRDEHSIPAPTLRDLIDHTQRLVFIAAHSAAFGRNPDFSDVRTLGKDVQRIATLSVSPFEGGSFVIPAELPDETAHVTDERGSRDVDSAAVVESFGSMMQALAGQSDNEAATLPIGFLQTVEEMGKIIGRHATGIEYTQEKAGQVGRLIAVDAAFVARAESAHRFRRGRVLSGFVTVSGVLVGLDLLRRRAKIYDDREDESRTISGVYGEDLGPTLARRMGQRISVFGPGVFRHRRINEITIVEVRDLDEGAS